ncbi:MAG TPA: hypothetical protein EYF95_05300 [Flavobacteriales bacterium]|jgi:hypothetical protein|nr:hypothetical protein [Flavobacteriales bacterium]
METITLTAAYAVAWGPDEFGSKTIINLLSIEVLKIPKRSAVGKTGADIRWLAHENAVITEDYRDE